MQGPLGGATQRVLRLGSRFAVALAWAPMEYSDARQFLARLLSAEASPVAVPVLQRGLQPVSPGALVVAADATGGMLPVTGGTPNFLLQAGQYFALSSGGRRWLHNLQDDVELDNTGAGTLPISPLLRVQPAAGDATEWVTPLMEGFIDMGSIRPTLEMLVRVGLKITLTEDR